MPKFAALDFKLKRGRPQRFGEKGMPVFATEADVLAPAAVSVIIPDKLSLSDKVSAEAWKQELSDNPRTKKAILVINKEDHQPLLRQEGQLLFFNLPDGGSVNPFTGDTFDKIYNFIDSNIQAGNQVLVHCSSGASRSPTIVTAYLMRKYGLNFETALYHVGACRHLAEPSSFKEHLEAYQQSLDITEPLTFLTFLKQHRTKLLWIGLGILALTSLVASGIAYPSAFLIGLLGAGVLGSGGALASSLSLGSLSALGLFSVIGAGLLATAGVLFSLVTFGVYKAENHSRQSLLGQTSKVASITATTPTASNAATAVLKVPGSSAAPGKDADANGALVTSKSLLAPPQPSGTILGTSSTAPGTNTVSGQGAASSAPPATIKL